MIYSCLFREKISFCSEEKLNALLRSLSQYSIWYVAIASVGSPPVGDTYSLKIDCPLMKSAFKRFVFLFTPSFENLTEELEKHILVNVCHFKTTRTNDPTQAKPQNPSWKY